MEDMIKSPQNFTQRRIQYIAKRGLQKSVREGTYRVKSQSEKLK